MILENYHTITKNIILGIRDGTIISNNSEKINNLDISELFILFTNEFNLNFHLNKLVAATLENDILCIPVPEEAIMINSLYFNNIGQVNISENLIANKSSHNIIAFDLTNNHSKDQITLNTVITMSYVSFTRADSNFNFEGL